jgi:U32 family peptidase
VVDRIVRKGGTRFVVNAPWQTAFFQTGRNLEIWAGPFCNASNPLAIENLRAMGCHGVIASPELGESDYLLLARMSPLPLGIVIYGNWPLCISRIKSGALKTDTVFSSPKKELAWVQAYDDNYWVYPEWPVDLRDCTDQLKKAGYKIVYPFN